MSELSASDGQLLQEFVKYMQKHPELAEGYNTSVPIERYILIGCFTILIWDYFITLDQEVNYVWSSPWFIGLPLFYVNRYVPFIDVGIFVHIFFRHMAGAQCNTYIQAAGWVINLPYFFGQTIIVLRTCALWQNGFLIVLTMVLLSISHFVVTTFFTAQILRNMQFAPTPSFMKGCISYEHSTASLYIYVALFVTEFIIVSLTIVKAVQHLRRDRTAWIGQLYKNGILYCMIILLFNLSNIIIPLTKLAYPYKQTLRMPQHVFHSMFCNRVFLQLLKQRHRFDLARRRREGLTVPSTHIATEDDSDTMDIETAGIFTTVTFGTTATTTLDQETKTDAFEMEVVGSGEGGARMSSRVHDGNRDGWIK